MAAFFRRRAREYERTCADCGYRWRVPRSAVRKPIAGFTGAPPRSATIAGDDPALAGSAALSAAAAAFGHCPECGSDRYAEQAVTA